MMMMKTVIIIMVTPDDDGSDIFIPQTVSNEQHYGRMNHRSAALTPPPAAIETKSILRNKGEGLSQNETISASQISLLSLDDPGGGGGIRRIRKRSSQVPMPSSAESFDGIPKSNVEVTTIHTGEISTPSDINGSRSMNETINASNSDNVNVHNNLPPPVPQPAKRAPSPTRGSLERNVSLPLTELQRPAKDRPQSSDSSFRYSADGSSASMRGMGDSLPRLPRRTSTMADDVDDGTDNKGRNEEKNTVQTENQNDDDIQDRDIGNDEASAASDSSLSDDLSLSIASDGDESADCSVETVEEDSVRLQQPSTTHSSLSEPQQQQEEYVSETRPSEVHEEVQQSIKDEIPEANSKDNVGLSVMETNPTSVDVAKSPSLDVNDEHEDQASEEITTLKPPRSKKQTKNNGEESGATIGTESEPEPESDSPAAESGKKTDPKRGNLIRRMSSTLRNAGKSASFRGSFKKIGKTASKIRQKSRRKDSDNDSSDVKPSSTLASKEETNDDP